MDYGQRKNPRIPSDRRSKWERILWFDIRRAKDDKGLFVVVKVLQLLATDETTTYWIICEVQFIRFFIPYHPKRPMLDAIYIPVEASAPLPPGRYG
jgi:hypothetical protein